MRGERALRASAMESRTRRVSRFAVLAAMMARGIKPSDPVRDRGRGWPDAREGAEASQSARRMPAWMVGADALMMAAAPASASRQSVGVEKGQAFNQASRAMASVASPFTGAGADVAGVEAGGADSTGVGVGSAVTAGAGVADGARRLIAFAMMETPRGTGSGPGPQRAETGPIRGGLFGWERAAEGNAPGGGGDASEGNLTQNRADARENLRGDAKILSPRGSGGAGVNHNMC